MKAVQRSVSSPLVVQLFLILIVLAPAAHAASQLLLTRGEEVTGEYKGVVEVIVNPGFDNAKVSITVDGQKIGDAVPYPHRVIVDFGPTAVEHKINITAISPDRRKVQWRETINRGHLPLTVNVKAIDIGNREFEAVTTAPKEDPVFVVELWDAGKLVESKSEAPYRFIVPEEVIATGFVQITAKTKSGEEAADFWSSAGDVHVEEIQVRTVPIFVSVVDRNGVTLDNVDRSLFRVLDNDAEAKIVEFGKAFDQPISIALLLDSSASMTYSLGRAVKAAQEFVHRTLKAGDRCSVYAVQEVPRRKQALTAELELVGKALGGLQPAGQTALYDSLTTAIRELKDEKSRRAIVVLTDGGDTSSIASFDEVAKATAQAGIPLYFISYDTGTDTVSRDLERLRHLSAQTGGFVTVATQQDIAAKYNEIEKDLRAQFAIRYQITDYARANEWRRVKVVLASPKMTARTIRGYFAP
jgi:VWFA-related protein